VLQSMELNNREKLPSNQRVARGRNSLSRKIEKVWKIYEPRLKLFKDAELAGLNRKNKTPSLKYQESGPRMQDS
jgi:predicted component of type VI protein secretion system